MKINKKYAFTLVELVVVITILAILGTIAYSSMLGYGQSARNSRRVSDIRLIEKAMGIYIVTESSYPTPDNVVNITYGGEIAWSQGTFSTGVLSKIRRISEVPIDPLTGSEYSYGRSKDGGKYQIGGITESGLLSYSPSALSQTYAVSSNNITSYIVGDYISPDMNIQNGSSCGTITVPSLLLSDIPAAGVISSGSVYNFSYSQSTHLPASYSGTLTLNVPGSGFQVDEVYDNCAISSSLDLELYIAKLSTAYQQLSTLKKYEDLVFYPSTNNFQLQSALNMEINGIDVSSSLLDSLKYPRETKTFTDNFTDANTTLITNHTPDSALGSWSIIAGGDPTSYDIISNTLTKNGASVSLIYPSPAPIIGNADYEISFSLQDFASGGVSVFLRYTDNNNYYKVDLGPDSYNIIRNLSGVTISLGSLSSVGIISPGDAISFAVVDNTLTLKINDIDQGSVVSSSINSIGVPAILIQNNNASIDNYMLTYKL